LIEKFQNPFGESRDAGPANFNGRTGLSTIEAAGGMQPAQPSRPIGKKHPSQSVRVRRCAIRR
jgi:hypothetical protein